MERPDVGAELAELIIGRHVIIGLTYQDHDGVVVRQEQIHGFVTRADATTVAVQVWGTDREFTLPPDLRAFEPAAPGEYRLRSTGEVVVDPDFTASWTITMPAPSWRSRLVRKLLPWRR